MWGLSVTCAHVCSEKAREDSGVLLYHSTLSLGASLNLEIAICLFGLVGWLATEPQRAQRAPAGLLSRHSPFSEPPSPALELQAHVTKSGLSFLSFSLF